MTCTIQKIKAKKKKKEANRNTLVAACQAHFSSKGDRLEQSFASLIKLLPTGRRKRHIILTATIKPSVIFSMLTIQATLQCRSSNVCYRHDRWPFTINHTRGIFNKTTTRSPTRPLSGALNQYRAQILPKKLNKPGQFIHGETHLVLAWLAQTRELAHLNRMPCNKFHHSTLLFTFLSNTLLHPFCPWFSHYAMTDCLFLLFLLCIFGRQT